MKMPIVPVGAALSLAVLCLMGGGATAQDSNEVRQSRGRPLTRVPIVRTTPYWDSYLVPRYRYRPEDDRVDPCGGPVIPVIRYGPQETTIPLPVANAIGLGRIHGRDWPCRGQGR